MLSIKFDIEKFNGRINFGLWQVQVKYMMIQSGLYKALNGQPTLDASKEGISTTKKLWEKLEGMYQAKGVSNQVYLKELFHTLRMNEGITISDHMSVLNDIISELEAIGVKIDDEDIALRLI
ncbi:hypothetical protein Patl1_23736 [Pistacia atlantica]|uniref:Uncharacterized protein n=1 Tax=Pistacia atlantica TaxID=434234 RepID=A0ACC0ZZV6_9ROSI|nr:hypothetical protein Patl1_23736 [Pistacia atlantica]